MTELKTRPPSDGRAFPLVLMEGPEMSGRAAAAAVFTASWPGDAYWLDLGEDTADEYGAVGNFVVVEHDGSWFDILGQVAEIHAATQGGEPAVLVINSMTAAWGLLKDWITVRARESRSAQKVLREDPNAEIKVSSVLWDEASARHDELMALLSTFNGVVVMIADCRETTTDADGRLIPGGEYRVDAHRGLPGAATVWVRMSRDEAPTLIGCRAPQVKVRPGVDQPLRFPDFALQQLLTDDLGYDLTTALPRNVVPLITDESNLIAQAQDAIHGFTIANGLDPDKVLKTFYRQHGEPLSECRDLGAVLQFFGQMKRDIESRQQRQAS